MTKQVFIINGSGGVGKDTFVNLVTEYFNSRYKYKTINFSSVYEIKRIAKIIGWDGVSKTEKDRKFLSDLKSLCTEYNDMPFKSMCKMMDEFNKSKYYQMLFLHIREPEEIERAKKEFNAKTILVKRNPIEHITSNKSDEKVYDYTYDIMVNNDGKIKDLELKVIEFVEDFVDDMLKDNY